MKTLDIILYLASIGAFSAAGGAVWTIAKHYVKSDKVKQIGDQALQAVQYAETVAGHETGAAQKQVATDFIGNLLKSAKIDKLFTPEQVEAELEIALLKLKQLGGGK